jgi:7,8-dihydropterin-6-yl-methyl-4-(beta-D-ribofuranosyl)aminobenzene 5'-phosphate synthase
VSSCRITVLMDNRAKDGLAAEHGLSLWIEADGINLLLDTGQSCAFARNAEALGIRLEDADALILSHGHYDHTGGIPEALAKMRTPVIFLHPSALLQRFSIRGITATSNGMPAAAGIALEDLAVPTGCHWVRQPVRLSHRIGLTGPIPRETRFEDTGGPFFLDAQGMQPDPIDDDMALWIETDDGLVVCTGCCHAGLVNTLHWIQEQSPGIPLLAVIGGLHLAIASEGRMSQTIAALQDMGVKKLIPLHCTGEAAVTQLAEALGKCVTTTGMSGTVLTFLHNQGK